MEKAAFFPKRQMKPERSCIKIYGLWNCKEKKNGFYCLLFLSTSFSLDSGIFLEAGFIPQAFSNPTLWDVHYPGVFGLSSILRISSEGRHRGRMDLSKKLYPFGGKCSSFLPFCGNPSSIPRDLSPKRWKRWRAFRRSYGFSFGFGIFRFFHSVLAEVKTELFFLENGGKNKL